MKTPKTSPLILATTLAVAVFVMLGLTTFSAPIPGDKVMAVALSAAIIYLAVWDYSRRVKVLRTKRAPLLRPALPIMVTPLIKGEMIRPRPSAAERSVA